MSLSDIIDCVDFSSSTIEEGTYVLSCTGTSISSEENASQFMQVYIEEEESPIKKEEECSSDADSADADPLALENDKANLDDEKLRVSSFPRKVNRCKKISDIQKGLGTSHQNISSVQVIDEKTATDHQKFKTSQKNFKRPQQVSDSFSGPSYILCPRTRYDKRLYMCEVCGTAFAKPAHLKIHLRLHSGERPFVCNVCGRAFNEVGNLNAHKRIHSGERPFICEVCGKSFTIAVNLKNHRRVHTGERPYMCQICGKTFTESSSLRKHRFIHSDQRPFNCEKCGKAYKQSGQLRIHQRKHSGERPYVCHICGAAFYQSGHLSKHQRIHSNDQKLD